MYVLAPSLLGADFTMLRQQILAVEEAGAGYLHLDVMDGRFVPNISFGMPVIASICRASELILYAIVKTLVRNLPAAGCSIFIRRKTCVLIPGRCVAHRNGMPLARSV